MTTDGGVHIFPQRRAVLFIRYVIATFMSPFWPDQCTALGISAELNGLIMASYPLGIAITSAVAPVAILRYGTKTVSCPRTESELKRTRTRLLDAVPTLRLIPGPHGIS